MDTDQAQPCFDPALGARYAPDTARVPLSDTSKGRNGREAVGCPMRRPRPWRVSQTIYPRPCRSNLPGVLPVHWSSSNVGTPLTMIA